MISVEKQIQELLTMKLSASVLSNALFGWNGLFGKIAHTEEERRQVACTPLFRQAQNRIMELSLSEAEELRRKYASSGNQRRVKTNGRKKLRLMPGEQRLAPAGKRSAQKKHRKSG
jgi:hypothetical protein